MSGRVRIGRVWSDLAFPWRLDVGPVQFTRYSWGFDLRLWNYCRTFSRQRWFGLSHPGSKMIWHRTAMMGRDPVHDDDGKVAELPLLAAIVVLAAAAAVGWLR